MSVSQSGNDLAPNDPLPTADPPVPSSPPAPPRWRSKRRIALFGGILLACIAACVLGLHLWAENQYAAAERALDQRNFREARARLARCMSVRSDDPDDVRLAVRIARRERANAEVEALIADFQHKHPADTTLDGEIRLFRTQRGHPSKVEAALTEALARGDGADPWELEAGLVGALEYLIPVIVQVGIPNDQVVGLLQKARRATDLWLELRPAPPDQVEGLVWRGVLRALSTDEAGAVRDLHAALALDPDHRDARFHLAITLKTSAPIDAAAQLQQLRQRYPDDGVVKFVLATIDRATGRLEEARELLEQLIAAEPGNVAALLERGELAMDQGQFEAAERWLTRAQHLAPADQRANFTLAACLRAAGRPAEAQALQDQFERLRNEHRDAPEQPSIPPPGGPRGAIPKARTP